VASVQLESAAGDKGANLAKTESFLQRAAAQGVELIAFPV
jgi:predicted amidohydrolase